MIPYPIERFALGRRVSVVLLGDPTYVLFHWVRSQSRSVPCAWPNVCPLCGDHTEGRDGDALLAAARTSEDHTARMVYADWCEEFGQVETAASLRNGSWHRGPDPETRTSILFPAMTSLLLSNPQWNNVVAAFSFADMASLGHPPFASRRYDVVRERLGSVSRLRILTTGRMDVTAATFDIWPHVIAARPQNVFAARAVARAATEGGGQ